MSVLGPGDLAPEFSVVDLDGREHRLTSCLERGPLLLAFGKSTCGTCELAFPYLERLYQAYPAERWTLLAVLQDAREPARRFATQLGLTFPIVAETAPYPLSREYDPEATPTLFLVEASPAHAGAGAMGRVADSLGGFAKGRLNQLSAAIASRLALAAVEVAPAGDGKPAFRPG